MDTHLPGPSCQLRALGRTPRALGGERRRDAAAALSRTLESQGQHDRFQGERIQRQPRGQQRCQYAHEEDREESLGRRCCSGPGADAASGPGRRRGSCQEPLWGGRCGAPWSVLRGYSPGITSDIECLVGRWREARAFECDRGGDGRCRGRPPPAGMRALPRPRRIRPRRSRRRRQE